MTHHLSFRHLVGASSVVSGETLYYHLVQGWSDKREALQVGLADVPALVEAYEGRRQAPSPSQSEITVYDKVPEIRLGTALVSLSNGVYSMAEVAAHFASRASGTLPRSFNKIRRKISEGRLDDALAEALGDLQWFSKVREIRTEWAHHSHIFVAPGEAGDPVIVVRSFRRRSDRLEFTQNVVSTTSEFIGWIERALDTLDRFAVYLLETYVVPVVREAPKFRSPVSDAHGVLIVKDGLFETEMIDGREHLARLGIDPDG